jgi:Xaa-Pro aminopeptidase
LLLASGNHDPDFRYASGFPVEDGLYLRFSESDDLLVVSRLELERARSESRVTRVEDARTLGWREHEDRDAAWADVAAAVLGERGAAGARVSPRLAVGRYEALRRAGVQLDIERGLFREERRRKSDAEVGFIRVAQEAAEAACVEVVRWLARAESSGGELVLDGKPVTSEWLMARAQLVLNERGCTAAEMIVAGSPGASQPHFRGTGHIRAGAPVVIDIFPSHQASGYHGDLTRTVVPGAVTSEVRAMHAACVAALETGLGGLRAGADGQDVHRATCQALVHHGFGTTLPGLEGPPDVPRMIHSTGHGVGLEVHEAPQLRNLAYPLVACDVVTVEPGLYHPRIGGVRVEDLVVIRDYGVDNVTTLTRSLDPADYL